jgi:DNA-binding NtrC family response regulator
MMPGREGQFMAIRALTFARSDSKDDDLTPRPGQWDSIDAFLTTAVDHKAPVAFLVPSNQIEDLRGYRGTVPLADRRVKQPSKALSQYLLGRNGRVPFVDGRFKDAGQARRSIRDLLSNAVERNDLNRYVVGAPSGVFEEIWTRSGAATPPSVESGPAGAAPPIARKDVPARLLGKYIGTSAEVENVRQLIVRFADRVVPDRDGAPIPATVLILGETGTGKDVIARMIHELSPRRHEAFVSINCGAIPSELLESELFGTVAGAATGVGARIGLWQHANRGTLFLDEVGELLPAHQAKILHALENRTIRRVGGKDEIKVDTRVIAATNRSLYSMVRAGTFRQDLYYRLRQRLIRAPTLRSHPEDIPTLARYFWGRIAHDGKPLSQAILDEMRLYAWPGNVRQLKTALNDLYELYGIDLGGDRLGVEHLRAITKEEQDGPVAEPSGVASAGEELARHRVECLRHLRSVDEVLRAYKVALRPVLDQKSPDARAVESVVRALWNYLRELDVLCLRPLLFHSHATFSVVLKLKGKALRIPRAAAGGSRGGPELLAAGRGGRLQARSPRDLPRGRAPARRRVTGRKRRRMPWEKVPGREASSGIGINTCHRTGEAHERPGRAATIENSAARKRRDERAL